MFCLGAPVPPRHVAAKGQVVGEVRQRIDPADIRHVQRLDLGGQRADKAAGAGEVDVTQPRQQPELGGDDPFEPEAELEARLPPTKIKKSKKNISKRK